MGGIAVKRHEHQGIVDVHEVLLHVYAMCTSEGATHLAELKQHPLLMNTNQWEGFSVCVCHVHI